MVRSIWCFLAIALSLIWPAAEGAAQQSMARLGVLWTVSDSAELAAFRDGLSELGYVENQNVAID